MRGPITLGMKRTGKPGAGDPHAGFDVAGAGDVTMGAGLRPRAKAMDEPPDPKANAPALDPTGGGRMGKVSSPVDRHCRGKRTPKRTPAQAENLSSRLPYQKTLTPQQK